MICAMSERDIAGVIFMPKTQLHHNGGSGGGGGGGEQFDAAMSDDVDSEVEDAPDALDAPDAPSLSVFEQHLSMDAPGSKRNKRKNFKPRSIFLTEPTTNFPYAENSDDHASDEEPEAPAESDALDLTGAIVRGAKKFKLAPTPPPKAPTPKTGFTIEDLTNQNVAAAATPMDLSTSDGAASRRCDEYSDSNSCDSEPASSTKERGAHPTSPPAPTPPQQMFLNQPADASDLKEYVKELLQIYVGDASDVADCIDKSVPMSNFSSGKILETLSARAAAASGLRSQMALPGSPFSLAALQQQHQLLQQHQQQLQQQQSLQKSGSTATPSPTSNSSTNTIVISTDSPRNKLFLDNCRPKENSTPVNSVKNFANFSLSLSEIVKAGGLSPIVDSPSTPGPCSSQQQQQLRQSNSPQHHLNREGRSAMPVDYSRYVRRFGSSMECGAPHCKDLNYREHFHCLDCNSRVFVKKEEMIRHFKWHKKRDESLQHGFMRYSPSDDCSNRYPGCTHNRKQTHYHCIQGNCDKVYISTSDVQMHANYHRKDSAIIQEGFQRLRATEECRTSYCAFFGQKTTHFHCRRDHCQYTFKNKADMEKHKTYHIKDEQLAKDGFKKFLKPDPCGFSNCKFSQVINHIHCVRDGCSYVLHSSGQLLSHKRKHERKDSEIAYRKFKLAQQAVINIANNEQISQSSDLSPSSALQFFHAGHSLGALGGPTADCSLSNSSSDGGRMSPPSLTMCLKQSVSPATSAHQQKYSSGFFRDNGAALDLSNEDQQELWPRYLRHFDSFQTCDAGSKCLYHEFDHFHCTDPSCEMPFRNKEGAENHARVHDTQERFNESFDQEDCHDSNCMKEKHFHCTWDGCNEAVLPADSIEHFRNHELAGYNINSLDALFRRKRGRPPKNRIIEIWNDYAGGAQSDSPQAIFTSFKLPKPNPGQSNDTAPSPSPSPSSGTNNTSQLADVYGFQEFSETCPDPLCMFRGSQHFHCGRPRCFFATNSDETLVSHAKDFHENIDIMDGFLFFDRCIDCRMESCKNNKMNRHFHCVQPGCGYSFVQYSNMAHHRLQHLGTSSSNLSESPSKAECDIKIEPKIEPGVEETNEKENSSQENSQNHSVISSSAIENENTRPTVVKASGTFYPLCGLSNISSSYSSQNPRTEEEVKREPASPSQKWAFSDLDKLKPHNLKHSVGTIPHLGIKPERNNNEEVDETRIPPGLSLVPVPHFDRDISANFPGFSAAMAAAVANQHLAMMTSHGLSFMPPTMPALYSSPSGLMFAAPPGFNPHHPMMTNGLLESAKNSMLGTNDQSAADSLSRRSISPQQNISPEMKKARVQSSMRMLKDEPVPPGYIRFRFNENCQYDPCGYREHQTHFHCTRKDCGYSFCDKTRFVQHTARHERLDTLMGGDFQQYRASVSCGRPDCTHTSNLGSAQNKAAHFHCLKCDFVCSDTNKVVSHRRQHEKMDSILAAGFEKFTPSRLCSQPETCPHSGKQTHYHCLKCQYAVLGLSQMTAHKYRHAD
nr:PREDICTED: uncharacterized protein LOC109029673 [Bemisia tabaci]XP_018895796.1 PREDICTED: uncharacterized protein LOC109029673 [Bemisia tabaci]